MLYHSEAQRQTNVIFQYQTLGEHQADLFCLNLIKCRLHKHIKIDFLKRLEIMSKVSQAGSAKYTKIKQDHTSLKLYPDS